MAALLALRFIWLIAERLLLGRQVHAWCQWDGDHSRGLRRHTECAFSYGSGAWGRVKGYDMDKNTYVGFAEVAKITSIKDHHVPEGDVQA